MIEADLIEPPSLPSPDMLAMFSDVLCLEWEISAVMAVLGS